MRDGMSLVVNSVVLARFKSNVLSRSGRLLPLLLVIFGSCNSNPTEDLGPVPLLTQGVYVLNQGVPGHGNSTLTYFIPDSDKVYQDISRAANGKPLGDTGSEVAVFGSFAYLVMSGSDEIEVIRTSDNALVATIVLKSGRNPFGLVAVGTKGYVTNRIASGSVTVLDLTSNTVLRDSISVGPYPEGIAAIGSKVYVCNADRGFGQTVSVIDATKDRVSGTITVGDGPSCADVTRDGSVWILCTGSFGGLSNPNGDTPGKIFVIDPFYDIVVDSMFVGGHPSGMAISLDDYAYVVEENSVLKYSAQVDELVTSGLVVGSLTSNYSAIAVDDYTNSIYVADARDFVQNGEVRIYGADGSLQGRFDTGVAPVSIAFRR
jgi:YVTN family beta-propeller protein